MGTFLFVLCLSVFAAVIVPIQAGSYVNSNGSWKVDWNIVTIGSQRWLECTMAASTTGWVAMGINTQPAMAGADIMWGQILANGTAVIVDRKAAGHSQPAKDTLQNLVLIPEQSSLVNGITTLSFRRLLNTGDAAQDIAIGTNVQQYLLWAYGSAKGTWNTGTQDYTFAYHSARGTTTVVFDTGVGPTPTPTPTTTTTTTTTAAPATTTTTTPAPGGTTTPSTSTTTTTTRPTTTTTTRPTTTVRTTTTTTPVTSTTTTTTTTTSTTTTTTTPQPPQPSPPPSPTDKSGLFSFANDDGSWKLEWNVKTIGTERWLEFTVKARTSGWVGMGIGSSESMAGADIMWGQILSNGTGVIIDRYAYSQSQPSKDTQQDVFLIPENSSEIDGVTTLSFRRKLDTGDTKMDRIIDTNSSQILLWAMSDSKGSYDSSQQDYSFSYHTARGLARVLFATGQTDQLSIDVTFRKAHGILMILAWAICSIFATFIARYLKTSQNQWFLYGYTWLHLHAAIQLVCVVANLAGFVVIVVWIADKEEEHFKSVHQALGLTIFISSILQPILGVATERLIRKDKEQMWIQKILGRVHWFFGWSIIILALINNYIGFYMLCVNTMTVIGYSLMIFVGFFMFLSHEALRWFAPWGAYLGGIGFSYEKDDEEQSLDAHHMIPVIPTDSSSSTASTTSEDTEETESDDTTTTTTTIKTTKTKVKRKTNESESDSEEESENEEGTKAKLRKRFKEPLRLWKGFKELRDKRQPPKSIKITLWTLQIGAIVVMTLLWIVVAIGISQTDLNDPSNSFSSSCVVGVFPPP